MVLNTNRISKMQVRDTTKSKFRYTFNLYDKREKYSYVESDTSVANWITAFDATWDSNAVPINYYPNADTSADTQKIYLHADSIALAVADASAPTSRSLLWFYDGAGKKNRILIAHKLDHLVDLGSTGTTSTF